MPAITVEDPLVLPRISTPAPDAAVRSVDRIVDAYHAVEGAGFEVWRPFPGGIDAHVPPQSGRLGQGPRSEHRILQLG